MNMSYHADDCNRNFIKTNFPRRARVISISKNIYFIYKSYNKECVQGLCIYTLKSSNLFNTKMFEKQLYHYTRRTHFNKEHAY